MPNAEDYFLMLWLGGFAALMLVIWLTIYPANAIELVISGNATGTGLHILEVAGPMVVGNGTSWLVFGGM